jgi:hypothetical protein
MPLEFVSFCEWFVLSLTITPLTGKVIPLTLDMKLLDVLDQFVQGLEIISETINPFATVL